MEQVPLISVVIPLYNKAEFIVRAIRSVLAQSMPDFEVIVVNDGSTDHGPDLVLSTGDSRVRRVDQDNGGVSAARNRGIAEARAELVAFLDADDEWAPEFLQTVQRMRANYPQAHVFATSYLLCYDNGVQVAARVYGLSDPWEGMLENYFAVAKKSDPPLGSSALAVTKEAMGAVGGFPLGVTSGEDLLTWARLAARYKIAFSTQRLSFFHLESGTNPSRLRRAPDREDLVGRELEKLLVQTDSSQSKHLRGYLGLWNRMRASALLRQGDGEAALAHALRAARLDPSCGRSYVFVLLSSLPSNTGKRLFSFLFDFRHKLEARRHR